MSRQRGRWHRAWRRAKRTVRAIRRHKVATVLALALLAGAVRTHPVAVALAAFAVAALGAGAGLGKARWRMRGGEPTDLYTHYFADGEILYVGISNRYDLRCGQHADDKWWWFYVDPARSTTQTWPNRQAALRAEEKAIRAACPIGNYQHNWQWQRQQPRRLELAARARRHASYGQPPPVVTTPTITPRPVTAPVPPAAGRGALTRRYAEWRPR